MTKKLLLVAAGLLILLVGLRWFVNQPDKHAGHSIGVVYLLRHPAIDEGLAGLVTELKSIERNTGLQISAEYVNAFGEPKNVHTIINTFKEKQYEAIVALTTPCAQIAKQLVNDRPVIFVGVSDPVAAGLVPALGAGAGNITGTMSKDPVLENLVLAKKLFPSINRVGVVYSASEANSQSVVAGLRSTLPTSGLQLTLETAAVSQSVELLNAATVVLSKADALLLINDNLSTSSADLLIRLARELKKPVFSSDVSAVEKGALFAYGLNYRDEGVAAARIVQRIFSGTPPASIPVFVNTKYYLHINARLTREFPNLSAQLPAGAIVHN